MHALSYTAARQNLAKTMKKVCENHDPVIITRNKSESVVMLSLEDYESISETNYLLRSPANAGRLCESIAELTSGKGKQRELAQ
jgi:antitoxin YefM